MLRKVIFSPPALKRLFTLLEYLELNWSIKVRNEFEEKLDSCIKTLVQMPESAPKSEFRKNHHKCVVTKQTTIFYRFNSKKIDITLVVDTRQDPKKVKINL